jgi:hypothetical protein
VRHVLSKSQRSDVGRLQLGVDAEELAPRETIDPVLIEYETLGGGRDAITAGRYIVVAEGREKTGGFEKARGNSKTMALSCASLASVGAHFRGPTQ